MHTLCQWTITTGDRNMFALLTHMPGKMHHPLCEVITYEYANTAALPIT